MNSAYLELIIRIRDEVSDLARVVDKALRS